MTVRKKTPKIPKKVCTKCLEEKISKDNFYMASDDIINSDGRLSICKPCLESIVDMEDVDSVVNAMRKIDRPFLIEEYEASKTYKNPFGEFMRRTAMPQNKGKTYMDSQFNESLEKYQAKNTRDINKPSEILETIKYEITPDLIFKWGDNYTEAEIHQLETFYRRMNDANNITTPQEIESLKLLCKLSLKQNIALDEDNHTAFKNLNTQYNKVLQDSGLRAIDKISGGESAGIRTFGQIWEEIEKDGFIVPYQYEEKQDIVDKTIMYMGNYTRKLLNIQTMSSPPEDAPQVDGDKIE